MKVTEKMENIVENEDAKSITFSVFLSTKVPFSYFQSKYNAMIIQRIEIEMKNLPKNKEE